MIQKMPMSSGNGGGGKVYQGTFTVPTSGTLDITDCGFKPKTIVAYGKKNSPSAANFYCRQFYDETLNPNSLDVEIFYASNDTPYGVTKYTLPNSANDRGVISAIKDNGFSVGAAASSFSRDYDYIAYG